MCAGLIQLRSGLVGLLSRDVDADVDASAMRYKCAILLIRIRIHIHIRIRIRIYAVLCQAASAVHFCLWLDKSNNKTNWKMKLTIQE